MSSTPGSSGSRRAKNKSSLLPSKDGLASQSNAQLRDLSASTSAIVRQASSSRKTRGSSTGGTRRRKGTSAGDSNDNGGVWLTDTKTLHHYAELLRNRDGLVLTVRVKPRPYLVSFVAGKIETLTLDPAMKVNDIRTAIATALLTPAQLKNVDLV